MIFWDDPNKVKKITNLIGKSEPVIQDLPSMKNKIILFVITSISVTTVIFTGGEIEDEDEDSGGSIGGEV